MDEMTLAILLTLISACAHAGINAVLKLSDNKVVLRALTSWVSAILFLPLIFLTDLPNTMGWIMLVASGVAHFCYQLCQIQSLKYADLSIAYPITRGATPVFTVIASILFLSETISMTAFVGICIISLSVLSGLSFAKMRGDTMLRKGVFWSLCTGFGVAIFTVIDSYGGQIVDNSLSFIAWFFLFNGVGISILSLVQNDRKQLKKIAIGETKLALIAGLCAAISYSGIIYAFSLVGGKTAELSALRETGVIFGMVLAYFILKEDITIRRLLSSVGILVGVAIIATS
ncbi:MAG: drug/metabolite transporter (DMT)-like permease [Alphaproteobacteria bacterium]|jgi:drug/metabolite transporter (DMT)-like permease